MFSVIVKQISSSKCTVHRQTTFCFNWLDKCYFERANFPGEARRVLTYIASQPATHTFWEVLYYRSFNNCHFQAYCVLSWIYRRQQEGRLSHSEQGRLFRPNLFRRPDNYWSVLQQIGIFLPEKTKKHVYSIKNVIYRCGKKYNQA